MSSNGIYLAAVLFRLIFVSYAGNSFTARGLKNLAPALAQCKALEEVLLANNKAEYIDPELAMAVNGLPMLHRAMYEL